MTREALHKLLALSEEGLAAELARLTDDLEPDDYLGRFERLVASPWDFSSFVVRMPLCREFAFAVPTEEALTALAELGPIVELGAGTGYWAYLLAKRGVDIVAYDIAPPPVAVPDPPGWVANHYKFTRQWTEVLVGTPAMLGYHGDRALFLCWPDYHSNFASQALDAYACAGGTTVAYIGEGGGGCTGDDVFHERLYREWTLVRRIRIPQWPSVHDDLSIYRALPPSEWRTIDSADVDTDAGDDPEPGLGAALGPSDWSGATVSVVGGDFDGGKGKVT